ncbi:hypothetical protein HY251_21325, partial [bacterium]|nr:hypothetical protein [bacterium]
PPPPPPTTVVVGMSSETDTGAMLSAPVFGGASYGWTMTSGDPNGASIDSGAPSATVSFKHAGVYTFHVTITYPGGRVVTGDLTFNIAQRVAKLALTPDGASIPARGSAVLTATATDQYGDPIAVPPPVDWSVTGSGTIVDPSGTGTAVVRGGDTPGTAHVSAATSGQTATTDVTVTQAAAPQPFFGGHHGSSSCEISRGGTSPLGIAPLVLVLGLLALWRRRV